MTESNTNIEPTFGELLHWSGMSPEVFRQLNDEQLAEWRRHFMDVVAYSNMSTEAFLAQTDAVKATWKLAFHNKGGAQ